MPKLVAIFPEQVPMWEQATRRLAGRFGTGVGFAYDLNLGGGLLAEAEVVLSFALAPQAVAAAPRLRWVQALGTGTEGVRLPADSTVRLTSAHGLHAAPVSEAALAGILAHARGLREAFADQAARRWAPRAATLLDGTTLGILGTGDIARALARKAQAFGMRVVGFSATPRALKHFDDVAGREALAERAGELDHLVLLAPIEAATRHIVDARVLAALKPGALLINVGRGALVDEAALLAALETGRIAAVLDTFEVEPLPADSQFWAMPNVIVTPHCAGRHRGYVDDVLDLFLVNYDRFMAGDIAGMRNLVRP